MMGLMLHANAKALIKKELYRDALEVLILGEEAFSLCNPKLIEMVDNVPILQIDMVWCYFMLRDINSLSVADNRLAKAREGIERAHGKESSRLRILQGGCYPELALHLRMELLEGVIAYHSGHLQKCKNALATAQTRYFQLQVPDESLSLLMNMGYKERRAKRALRMNNLDVGRAVDFLVEEEKTRARKREENLLRQQQIIEQKEYGLTPLRKAVDLQKLDELVSIGFQKDLVAEALRRNENNFERALDDLTNPETNALLQNEVISRKRSRRATSENGASASNTQLEQPNPDENNAAHGPDPSIPLPVINELDAHEGSNDGGSGGGPSTVKEQRDMEMEEELTGELQKTDAYSDYDIDVTKEGEALHEYLALLNSAPQGA